MEADIRLLRAMAGQFLMGAMMGALFVGVIMLANVKIVAAIVDGSPFPIATTVIVFAGPMLYFAFGAAITGFLFLVSENGPDEPDRGVSSRMHAITHARPSMQGQSDISKYFDGMIEHDGHVGQILKALDDLSIANDARHSLGERFHRKLQRR
jgi:hypothetical protein